MNRRDRLEQPRQQDAQRPDEQPQRGASHEPAPSAIDPTALADQVGEQAMELLRRHRLLRPLIKELVLEQALANETLNPEERNQALEQQRNRNRIADAEALARTAAHNGMSVADLERSLLLPLLRARHCRKTFGHRAETTFLRTKGDFDQVVYSLLRVKDGHLAFELHQRLVSGEADFPELASQFSEGPERLTRGLVGPAPLTRAHPVLVERLRTAQPGVVLNPIVAQDLFLVVRLERLIPATFDEAMAQRICDQLFEQWLEDQVNAILSGTTQGA